MMPHVVRRILWLIPTLIAMALVTFLVMHATPGSPLEPEGGNNPLSPAEQKNLAAKYGLDRPLWEQFGRFLFNALRGDFGNSYVY
jgi:oligopeptide transport system permease protein